MGRPWPLGSITFDSPPTSVNEVGEEIRDAAIAFVKKQLQTKGSDLFNYIFSEGEKFVRAIIAGVIHDFEEAEKVATYLFKGIGLKDYDQIARLMIPYPPEGWGADGAAKGLKAVGRDAKQIADAFQNLGLQSADVLHDALSAAGFDSSEVSDAVTHFGQVLTGGAYVKVPSTFIKLP